MTFILGFVLGSVVMFLLILILSCLVVAKRSDRMMEIESKEDC
ncbi:MAG: hypothetical protein ACRCST_14430 [Turicibacter sp.]